MLSSYDSFILVMSINAYVQCYFEQVKSLTLCRKFERKEYENIYHFSEGADQCYKICKISEQPWLAMIIIFVDKIHLAKTSDWLKEGIKEKEIIIWKSINIWKN